MSDFRFKLIEKKGFKEISKKLNKPEFRNKDYREIIESSYNFDNKSDTFILKDEVNKEEQLKILNILKATGYTPFESLEEVVSYLRDLNKKYALLFAYNGTGKTRLSMKFKEMGKKEEKRDTLYFNAFTEDLFSWDNDLDDDTHRVLLLNKDSKFFGEHKDPASEEKRLIETLDLANKIRPLLQRYADFNFDLNFSYKKQSTTKEEDNQEHWAVNFIREEIVDGTAENIDHIKVSRGEENIFIWCFFLAIAQLAIDEVEDYRWVKYIYIDDPISSLDDNNTIAVASHLAQMLKKEDNKVKTVISSHHTLFFNVMCNELNKGNRYFLSKIGNNRYTLTDTTDTPFFHHVSLIKDLHDAVISGELFTYHFNVLRSILEKTASFHGFTNFSDCIKKEPDDDEGIMYTRMVNILSHGNYSLYEPVEMLPENKEYFKKIFKQFRDNYAFNPDVIPELKDDNIQAKEAQPIEA